MKTITGGRASAVLYNWLLSNYVKGKALIPANICESVPATYMKAGISVDFCDVEFGTWLPYEAQIFKLLDANLFSVLHYNHTYGEGGKSLARIRNRYPNLIIVEDCCLGIPKFEAADDIADLVLFSTGHTKVVNIGYGGFAITLEKYNYKMHTSLYYQTEKEAEFNSYVKSCHEKPQKVDTTIILSDWIETSTDVKQNYFQLVKEELVSIIPHKKQLNEIYRSWCFNISEDMQLWRYNVLVDNQTECLAALYANGLYASKHYMSLGNGFFSSTVTPNINWLEKHIINLFNDRKYTVKQAEETVEILKKVAKPL